MPLCWLRIDMDLHDARLASHCPPCKSDLHTALFLIYLGIWHIWGRVVAGELAFSQSVTDRLRESILGAVKLKSADSAGKEGYGTLRALSAILYDCAFACNIVLGGAIMSYPGSTQLWAS
jgi:hypothetical protein